VTTDIIVFLGPLVLLCAFNIRTMDIFSMGLIINLLIGKLILENKVLKKRVKNLLKN
jgi:hypothetical protein